MHRVSTQHQFDTSNETKTLVAMGDKQVYKLALTSFWSWDDGCIKTMEQLVREKKGETFFNKSINMILADTPRTMEKLH